MGAAHGAGGKGKCAGKAAAPAAGAAAAGAAAEGVRVLFPPSLTPRQRAALHAAAEAYGLPHSSSGEGEGSRRIALGAEDAETCVEIPEPESCRGGGNGSDADGGDSGAFSDEQLCALLQQHLRVDAAPHLAAAAAPRRREAPAAAAARAAGFGAEGRSALAKAPISLEEFVDKTSRLLDLEREADIQQATEATSTVSPERAQARPGVGGPRDGDPGRAPGGRGAGRAASRPCLAPASRRVGAVAVAVEAASRRRCRN